MSLYHSVQIGSLSLDGNLFLAPVAGYSDRAFRSVCVQGGASFCYTEMVSMEALTRGSDKTALLMRRAPNEKAYAVQIFGGNPEVMEEGARMVLERTSCELIDINCGCPVPKIIKSGAGSELTRNPEKLYKIVSAVAKAAEGRVPVTVKIRSGWDSQNLTWKEAADAAIKAGAAAITIHPRTRAQGYEGKADWNILAELVKFSAGRVPIFGSGDAFSPQEAKRMLEESGCDAVMFARGAMGRPFIFRQTQALLETGSFDEIPIRESLEAGLKELDILSGDIGEKAACLEMRKRFCAYSKGVQGVGELRRRIVQASSRADYQDIFAPFLQEA